MRKNNRKYPFFILFKRVNAGMFGGDCCSFLSGQPYVLNPEHARERKARSLTSSI